MGRHSVYNNITTPESIAKFNKDNVMLKDEWMEYLDSIGKSKGTIALYRHNLDVAFQWNLEENDNKMYTDWSKRNILALQSWMIKEHKNSPARVRNVKATLSSFSDFIESMYDDEFPTFKNIINKVKSPPLAPVREATNITDEQAEQLLEYLVSKKKYDRACMFSLAINSGRRKSELVLFKVDDFKDENLVGHGALYKTSEKKKTKGRGQGKFLYLYTFAKDFKPYLDLWLEQRKEKGIADSEWLFPMRGDPSKPMNTETVYLWFTSFGKYLGIDLYPHSLRHKWTDNAEAMGLRHNQIRAIQGWESDDMVSYYLSATDEEMIENIFDESGNIAQKNGLVL